MDDVRQRRHERWVRLLRSGGHFEDDEARERIAEELASLAPDTISWAVEDDLATKPADARRYRFLSDEDLENLEMPPSIIDGIIREQALAALFGPPGAGKSLCVLDWGLCIELGIPWIGGRQTRMGRVVYVIAEGAATLGPRITAWKDYQGAAGEIGLTFLPEPVPLMDKVQVALFIHDLKEQLPEPPTLVVFDTLARCMSLSGGDENSAKDMGLLIQGADGIREELGCSVLLVHHTNKSGESERGSTALRGAVDTLLSLKKSDDGIVTLSCEKQKDGAPFEPIKMAFEPHQESVVLRPRTAMAVGSDELTPGELDTLRLLAVTAPPEGLAATRWLEVTEKKERTFWNHRKRLDEKGYVLSLKAGGATRYVVSSKGNELLGGHCHGTAI